MDQEIINLKNELDIINKEYENLILEIKENVYDRTLFYTRIKVFFEEIYRPIIFIFLTFSLVRLILIYLNDLIFFINNLGL